MQTTRESILNFKNVKTDGTIINSKQIEHLVHGLCDVLDSGVPGDVVELGCYVGEAGKYTRRALDVYESSKRFYVYDSFEGLPDLSKWEEGTPWRPRTLKTTQDILVNNFEQNNLKKPDKIVKGWFKDIKDEDLPQQICYAFLDGDFYDSIHDSLTKIYDRVAPGGHIYFHDYRRPDLPGVDGAIKDFLEARGEEYWVYSVTNQVGLLIKGGNKIQPKKKLGFLHIPRTGGTHLERVISQGMGPDKFINFFGSGSVPEQGVNGIPIIETMKPGDNKNQRLLQNENYKTCELFAGHFSHSIEDCFSEDVEFFTILRNPVQRVTSMTKQFLTSKIYRDILMEGAEKRGDDVFWKNVEKYLNTNNTDGLLAHEVHGFSNYMTKCIAGCDTSDPDIMVTQEIYNKAITNLQQMKYVGFFEDYKKSADDILSMIGVDVEFEAGALKVSDIPTSTQELFLNLNKYDVMLYKHARDMQSNRVDNITYVTALVDINRGDLGSPNFQRSFDKYLKHLKLLLESLKDQNMVVYVEPEHEKYVQSIKSDRLIVKSITCDDLRSSEYYNKIQTIRQSHEWLNQASWLEKSPQAQLELYNPLIFQKIHLLDEVSRKNPYGDDHFVWVDAGIGNAQCDPSIFQEKWYKDNILEDLDKFLFINFKYTGYNEIHGFAKAGLKEYVSEEIDRVSRATFFGGRGSYVQFLSDKFRELAHKTLDAGYLGTEESIYTLMSYIHKNKINNAMIPGHGLVRGYFDSLKSGEQAINVSSETSTLKPKPYKGVGNQQSPAAFDLFEKFFKDNQDVDLVIDIGTGRGGFSIFLKNQCDMYKCKFVTFDSREDAVTNIKSKIDDVDARQGDVFDVYTQGEIESLIDCHQKVVILCDGGNQTREFNTFSDLIKHNDIIMAHDYAPDRETFESEYKDKIWNWMEICDDDISDAVARNQLTDTHGVDLSKAAWVCKQKRAAKRVRVKKNPNEMITNLYILTFNFPEQLEHTFKFMSATPELIERTNMILLDNSTDMKAKKANEQFASRNGFDQYIHLGGNTGICGGRQAAAEHFDKSDADYMLFFEDDMTVNSAEKRNEFCRNGFRKYIPNMYNIIHKIMIKEEFDFLKLSFTEVYFDNDKQCAWYNVPQDVRTEHWPDYDKLPTTGLDPNVPLTQFENIGNVDGVTYISGDVYYANWPMIVSREGNKKMFINTTWKRPYEQTWMSHMFKMTRSGELKPGLLLASPIWHDRIKHYKPEDRVES